MCNCRSTHTETEIDGEREKYIRIINILKKIIRGYIGEQELLRTINISFSITLP